MSDNLIAAAILILLFVIVFYMWRQKRALQRLMHTDLVRATFDGHNYNVLTTYGSAPQAAELLSNINDRLLETLRALRARLKSKLTPERRKAITTLLSRYRPDSLFENSPADPSGDTSYAEGKGAKIALCLRSRQEPLTLHDLDTMTFVALHELTHLAVESVGTDDHPTEFWETFRFVLETAEAAGVFTSRDYSRYPFTYCGIYVNYNPRFDPGLEPAAAGPGRALGQSPM